MKLTSIFLTLSIISTASTALAHEAGSLGAVAKISWMSVEECIINAESSQEVDTEALNQEYGSDASRLYIEELKIFEASFQFIAHPGTDHEKVYSYHCDDMFPHFSRMHFPSDADLVEFIKKTRNL